MEELDLKEIFSYFWNKKLYILLITVCALFAGCIYTFGIQKPVYKSDTTILLTKESDTSSITSNDIALNQKLVDTYREIIKSRKVLGRVINNLGLDYSISELSSKVSVTSINETEIIKISVVDLDNRLASDIANEIASVFNSQIVKLYNIQNIGVIDRAEVANAPYNVNVTKQLVIASLIGFILGCALVFVIFYFDNTIKSVEEVENKLKLPIIGTVPESGGRKHE